MLMPFLLLMLMLMLMLMLRLMLMIMMLRWNKGGIVGSWRWEMAPRWASTAPQLSLLIHHLKYSNAHNDVCSEQECISLPTAQCTQPNAIHNAMHTNQCITQRKAQINAQNDAQRTKQYSSSSDVCTEQECTSGSQTTILHLEKKNITNPIILESLDFL